MIYKDVKIIAKDKDGNPIRESDPLHGTGITLANFEVKQFVYDTAVKEQIAKQQEKLYGDRYR